MSSADFMDSWEDIPCETSFQKQLATDLTRFSTTCTGIRTKIEMQRSMYGSDTFIQKFDLEQIKNERESQIQQRGRSQS
jgi:hypothetical protein